LKNVSDETGLLAVQGPRAEALIAPLTSLGVAMIPYYQFAPGKVAGVECFLSRTGYTGEDGFELYCRGADLERLWQALVGPGRGGTVTPTTSAAIGMTYLPRQEAQPGARFEIDVRGKRVGAEVVKLPFVPHRTRR